MRAFSLKIPLHNQRSTQSLQKALNAQNELGFAKRVELGIEDGEGDGIEAK